MKRPFERLRCCGHMSDCTRERDPLCAAGSSAENDSHAVTSYNDTPGHTQVCKLQMHTCTKYKCDASVFKFSSFFVCFQETNALSAISVRNVSCGVTTSQSITKHTSTQRACKRHLSQGFKNFEGDKKEKHCSQGL